MPAPADVPTLLRDVFGFDGFRAGQEAVVGRLLAGRSVLAVFPTGGGKSLCYQLPALRLTGLTLVVSPLIALMKDQLDFLTSKGVAAARLDSTLDLATARAVFTDLRANRLKLLYVAPERLASERFLQTLSRQRIAMLAIDEAHCISEWGHNFRPDYLKLARLAGDLKVGRVLALTATATPSVAADIARAFQIADDDVVRTDFHRPNLALHVTPCQPEERRDRLHRRLRERPRGPAIVYVTLQKTAEQVAEGLATAGFPARAYHAGLDTEVRTAVQDWFMASPDAIVAATIAFGMGIDKRDIRAVYHYNLPKALENYAQEIGRAGRDGLASHCELLACSEDRVVLENFTYGDTPTPEAVAGLLDEVLSLGATFDVSIHELSTTHDIRPLVVETLLTYLELEEVLEGTGPFYREYKFQPLRKSADILARFDAGRAKFLAGLFRRARKAHIWFTLDVDAAAREMGEPRERIVSALNYLEEQGDLTLQVAGARQGYRRKGPAAAGLRAGLVRRFAERERRDLARLKGVLDFADHAGCRTRYLLAYFGEELAGDCGHCDWCGGARPGAVPPGLAHRLGERETAWLREVRAERQNALATPRQQARFLCGLPSPAASKARLTRHAHFGALAGVPFAQVLDWVTVATGGPSAEARPHVGDRRPT